MPRIYLMDTASLPDDDYFGILSAERAVQIRRCTDINNKKLFTGAELLLIYALYSEGRLKKLPLSIVKNALGKPHLAGRGPQFNISHSHTIVCVGISRSKIGVDIEVMRDINLKLAQRIMTKREYAVFCSLPDSERIGYFYDRWVTKEAYSKLISLGLRLPFANIEIKKRVHAKKHRRARCHSFDLPEFNAKLAVCTARDKCRLIKISPEELTGVLNLIKRESGVAQEDTL